MRTYQAYPTYRKANFTWLGKIPSHWIELRLKDICNINRNTLSEQTDPNYEIQYIDISSVDEFAGVSEPKVMRFADAPSRARRVVKAGNTIISTVRTYLKAITYFDEPEKNLVVSTGFAVLEPKGSVHPRFLYYLVSSKEFINNVVINSVGIGYPAINPSDLATLPVWLPGYAEQKAIAEYLDRETARIDALIAKNQRLIELLIEKKEEIIRTAVVRGLRNNVSYKETSIEWLGKIPSHWQVSKIKYLSQVKRGASPRPIDDPIYFDDNGEFSWVRISDVTASTKYLLSTEQKLSAYGQSKCVSLEAGELFLSICASVGKPIISSIKCCIHDGFVWLKGLKLNKDYYYYLLLIKNIYTGLGKTGTQLNLNTDFVSNIVVPVPPINEQIDIASFLDKETKRIQVLTDMIEHEIQLLSELRSVLISFAVTGKIDVRFH